MARNFGALSSSPLPPGMDAYYAVRNSNDAYNLGNLSALSDLSQHVARQQTLQAALQEKQTMQRDAEALQTILQSGAPDEIKQRATFSYLFRYKPELAAQIQDRMAARQENAELRRETTESNNALRRELAGQQEATRRELAGQSDKRARELQAERLAADERMKMLASSLQAPTVTEIQDPNDPAKTIKVDAKTGRVIGKMPIKGSGQLPTPALKLQQAELDAIGLASSITADLDAVQGQLESGALKVGPIRNLASQAKNVTGFSDENSRNFNSFKTTLEKLRNDSLRLNKGVQTEGDAVRAWNELMGSINDPGVVKQRLGEIREINNRAVLLRRANIDTLRANFGAEPLDTERFSNVPAAVGKKPGQMQQGPITRPEAKRKRWNPQTRQIEEY